MTIQEISVLIKARYIDPYYPFKDRLYFLFGTAGTISAGSDDRVFFYDEYSNEPNYLQYFFEFFHVPFTILGYRRH